MRPIVIAGANVEFGGPGFETIQVRREVVDGRTVHILALQPTLQEINAMVLGAPIYLSIMGEGWPPVLVTVGDAP